MKITVGQWICADCGRYLSRTPVPQMATWHMGRCDYCNRRALPVTEPIAYGNPTRPGREIRP